MYGLRMYTLYDCLRNLVLGFIGVRKLVQTIQTIGMVIVNQLLCTLDTFTDYPPRRTAVQIIDNQFEVLFRFGGIGEFDTVVRRITYLP